jgi:glutathione synthase/RimK-type ligase-like ATP-grasp enzyme
MSRDGKKLVGFIIGREKEMPEAVMAILNERYDSIAAELVKIGGTFLDETVPYDVIIDRMSHEIPYYHAYVKYAALKGCYVINNPFVWVNDTKFFAGALMHKLGIRTPRTVVLPNKDIAADTVPDSFRNLTYPMDWQAVIDYIGSPAIFKDVRSGGRRFAHRVNNVDELIQRYDESGTRTMILQQVIESSHQYHCLIIGGDKSRLMPYSLETGRYVDDDGGLPAAAAGQMTEIALQIAHMYGYDINMTEFVLQGDLVYLINATNPSPLIGRDLMTEGQFNWICDEIAALAARCVEKPGQLWLPVRLPAS